MSRRYSHRRMLQSVAAEIGPDDGVDPRTFFRHTNHPPGRKAMQLCHQVREALYWVLGSACGDEALALLNVVSVEPAPDTTRMLVTLAVPEEMTFEEATKRLHRVAGTLRREVAGAIHRRKVPDLVYRYTRSNE